MSSAIRVILNESDFIDAKTEDDRLFISRMKLRSAGIPLTDEYYACKVTRGTLRWWRSYEDNQVVVEWKED